ncbi:MAG: hypothetical protein KDA84_06050, partial [Planctomycetaceae bacterium]|nr:hypothetical protein [Planctomycetaceae bacterium]
PTFQHKKGLPLGGYNSLSQLDIKGINEIYPGLGEGAVPFVYHNPNFQHGVAIQSGSRNLKELDVNDRITGVRIPKGWTMTLYRHPDFRGERIQFTGPTEIPDLRKVEMKRANGKPVYEYFGSLLRKLNWNDQASSVLVDGPDADVPPNGNQVVLYEHSYWRGRRLTISTSQKDLRSKTYRFNDIVSSVYVPSGHTVELYEHPNFEGRRVRIVGPVAIKNLHLGPDGRNWGDQFSSLKILGG